MSSMRNAVQRRNHKERAQPHERSKWGLLEKHKDYSKRAADHNLKKRKLKALQQKASERNEDEFYFGMVNSETKAGIKQGKRGEENSGGSGGRSLPEAVVKLMKTQDVGYLGLVVQRTRRLRERVEREVVVFDEEGEMVGGQGEADEEVDDVGVDLDDLADLDGLDGLDDGADVDMQEEEDEGLSKEELAARRRKKNALKAKQRYLDALRDREDQLTEALRRVEAQRARMNGTVGGVNKNGVKFKVRERKR
ncbi:hypothetical protein KC343_g5839 [Hortaea werneckii]|nr:hypothetical protein KC317_g6043 [Hortaea werneckii]KAI7627966.1 hypothetical protein KC343_g5839 [Hortaea werneckii]KAI7661891.1 hypothetical protein KC319_g8282 [Hortaea werneckii]KAI7706871.1 hypothetical protein KC322_g5699 [Hortaea werneckii]